MLVGLFAEAQLMKKEKGNLSFFERQFARIAAKKLFNLINPYVMTSWRTTLAGAIGALGTFLVTVNEPAWLPIVGQILVGLSLFLMGATARDNKVTSEQANTKK